MPASARSIDYISSKQDAAAWQDWDPKGSQPCLSCRCDLHLGVLLLLRKKKNALCVHVCGQLPEELLNLVSPSTTIFTSPRDCLCKSHVAPIPLLFIFLGSERFIPLDVKLFNIINHARIFVRNLRWTSFNWYIILFPLAIRFKWFHA